jgi:molybdate transport system substrate-binding protein
VRHQIADSPRMMAMSGSPAIFLRHSVTFLQGVLDMSGRSEVLCMLATAIVLLSPAGHADNLRVAVASNFAPVLEQLQPLFEKASGHQLTLIAGATGQHYTQIVNGAPFDVFLAADAERPLLLETEGHAVAASSFTYALGKLVLWSTYPELVDDSGSILHQGDFRHLAIANPQLAPYGKAAQQVLVNQRLWESMQGRLVLGENITQTLQFVQTANAELGFIALSQWLEIDPDNTGSHWNVPQELYDPIVQQAVILNESSAARAFVAFMQSDASKAVIQSAGYALP